MHRSGTSLVASWLERCGLDLGDEYFEATYGNPRGHFEDLLFVDFHKRILARQGLDFVLAPDTSIQVSPQDTREAYTLLRERSGRPQWGWKDPRTTLFLEFWRARLLQLRVLGMYRPYNSVVWSLMRRDLRQNAGPIKKMLLPYWHHPRNRYLANRYLATWIRYNQALLEHAREHPAEVLLARADRMEADAAALHTQLRQRWGFHLQSVPLSEVWAREELQREEPLIRYQKKLLDQADRVWEQLEALRFRSMHLSAESASEARSKGQAAPGS